MTKRQGRLRPQYLLLFFCLVGAAIAGALSFSSEDVIPEKNVSSAMAPPPVVEPEVRFSTKKVEPVKFADQVRGIASVEKPLSEADPETSSTQVSLVEYPPLPATPEPVPVVAVNESTTPAPSESPEPKTASIVVTNTTESMAAAETDSAADAEPLPVPTPQPVRRKHKHIAAAPAPAPEEEEAPASTFPALPQLRAPQIAADQRIGLDLYVGLGLNYFQYNEDLTDVKTAYKGFKGPSYHLGAGFEMTPSTDVEVAYKLTPMVFDNASVSLNGTKENWETTVMQFSTSTTDKIEGKEDQNDFRLLYGLQFHQLPLALFENSTNKPTLRMIQLLDASLGAKRVHYLNPWTRTTILGRLQYPISYGATSSGSLTIKPNLLFDGSVGIEKRLRPSTWFGVHWYGQYQNINFQYKDTAVTADGKQSAVFSTLEMRLTFDY